MPDPHQRRCHDCGHVDTYSDSIVPECLCRRCRSQDTRRVKGPRPPRQLVPTGNLERRDPMPVYLTAAELQQLYDALVIADLEHTRALRQLVDATLDEIARVKRIPRPFATE
jgi:hypothetical protein